MAKVYNKMTEEKIINYAKALAVKFVKKVDSGMARSVETYSECNILLDMIVQLEKDQ